MASTTDEERKASETDSVLWCNFCGFKTTDQEVYLSHSCKDILDAQGKNTAPTDQKECR
ncbi:MAG TPA: hypothetical protein VGK19_23395 [Capsulimonadaceae bacterium]|jgi:hypothetical protein